MGQWQKGVPISGPQKKTLRLNELMKGVIRASLLATGGWIDEEKAWNQITVDKPIRVIKWHSYCRRIPKRIWWFDFLPQQVYNADKIWLNFKALPIKNLASQEESSAPGFKMKEQRLAVLACSNAVGLKKLP